MERDPKRIDKLLADLSLMERMTGRWQRLCDLVERKEMTAEIALRGFKLAIEAALEGNISDSESTRLVCPELKPEERDELELLRTRVAELNIQLATAQFMSESEDAPPKTATVARRTCPSVPPSAATDDPVENWRQTTENLFRLYDFNGVEVPRAAITAEELEASCGENKQLIYRPPDVKVSYGRLMEAIGLGGHSTLREGDRSWIAFSPTSEGYWFWAEIGGSAPRRGKNFIEFERQAPAGWEVLSLEEYLLAWVVMKEISCDILDQDEPVCLRTAYHEREGANEVLQVRSHVVSGRIELLVRGLPRNAALNGKLGARYRRLVPSVRLPG